MHQYARLVFSCLLVACTLAACTQPDPPTTATTASMLTPTGLPQPSLVRGVEPTQTRAAELAQLATLTAPTATPAATNAPVPPTATPVPPPPTTVPPTASPIPPTSTATPQATITVDPQPAPAGTGVSFLVTFAAPSRLAGVAAVAVVDERGQPKYQGKVQSGHVGGRNNLAFSILSADEGPCTCTAYFVLDGKRVASTSFVVTAPTSAAAPTAIAPPAGGSAPYAPTQSRTEGRRAVLLRQIDVYEREVYLPYAPRDKPKGDWRPFYLKLEAWLPQYPEFWDYFAWVYERYDRGAYGWSVRAPDVLRASYLDTYLAERR